MHLVETNKSTEIVDETQGAEAVTVRVAHTALRRPIAKRAALRVLHATVGKETGSEERGSRYEVLHGH